MSQSLIKQNDDLTNKFRGLLRILRLRIPTTVQHDTFDDIVRPQIEANEILLHAVLTLLDARIVIYKHFLDLNRRVKQSAKTEAVCMQMMAAPGVGPIAALTFKAAIDYPARFKSSRTVAGHFGLTPRRYQSGEQDNPGRISNAVDKDVSVSLYASANTLPMCTMAG